MDFNTKIEEGLDALDVQTDALLESLAQSLGAAVRLLADSRSLNRHLRSASRPLDNDIGAYLDEASIEKLAQSVARGVEIGLGGLDVEGEEPEPRHSFIPVDQTSPAVTQAVEAVAPAAEPEPVKRGPGRPKKIADAAPAPSAETAPVKRGPGRPKKVDSTPAPAAEGAPVKRGPGRPRKDGSPPAPAPVTGKRGPGRPKKIVDAPQVGAPAQDEGQPSTAAEIAEAPMVAEAPVVTEAPVVEEAPVVTEGTEGAEGTAVDEGAEGAVTAE